MFLNGKDQYCKNEQTEHTYKLNTIPHMVLVELSRAGEPDMLAIFRRVKIWEWSIKFEERRWAKLALPIMKTLEKWYKDGRVTERMNDRNRSPRTIHVYTGLWHLIKPTNQSSEEKNGIFFKGS